MTRADIHPIALEGVALGIGSLPENNAGWRLNFIKIQLSQFSTPIDFLRLDLPGHFTIGDQQNSDRQFRRCPIVGEVLTRLSECR